jgi:hypothetical protein
MLGHFAKYAPWELLNHYVYPFKQMRVPSRFVVLTTIFMSIFAGFAIDRWPAKLEWQRSYNRRAFASFLIVIGIVGVGDMMSVRNLWASQAWQGAPQDFKRTPAVNLHYGFTPGVAFLDLPYSNVADLGCWEEWSFESGAPIWTGDVPQAKVQAGPAKVLLVDRTMNTFTADVEADGPSVILFNTTYDRGWRSDVGEPFEANKMLAVNAPGGKYTMHVRYWPHGMTVGLVLSGLSTLLLSVLGARALLRLRKSRRGTVAV